MGQKINPISLRLHSTNRHFDSCWYSNYFYKNLITKDIFLQQYFNNFLKLLKLPTGRYSIQHLQKKTQVYNFLCYPKFTREWRSKIFGLKKKKNSFKKTRYFLKTKAEFKKKVKKHTKLNSFYTTLNQLALHKIQKKITSFQNFRLWSTLLKKSRLKKNTFFYKIEPIMYQPPLILNVSNLLQNTKMFSNLNNLRKDQKGQMNHLIFPVNYLLINTVKKLNTSFSNNNQLIKKNQFISFPNYSNFFPFFIKKWNKPFISFPNYSNLEPFDKFGTQLSKGSPFLLQKLKKQNLKSHKNNDQRVELLFKEQLTNSNLLFLQNLFIYKTLKTNLKVKKNVNFLDQKKTYSNLVTSEKIMKFKPFVPFPNFSNSSNFFPFGSFFSKKRTNKFGNKLKNGVNGLNIKSLSAFNTLNLKYKNYLESSLSSLYNLEMDLIPFKVKNDWQNANYLADEITYFLEKRIPFRRLKGKILRQLSKIPEIRGIRILCSGRVGGKSKKAQRSKTECIKYGQTSLQVFSSKIDFSAKTAFTSFGSVGVKVWICYN